MQGYKKIDPKELAGNPFELLGDGWALITAKKGGKWNTMTVSYGTMGILWMRSVFNAYVRQTRYTYEFLDAAEGFSVSLFDKNECRAQLNRLGSTSGRNMDKMNDSGLTPVEIDGEIAFSEAKTIFICRKLFGDVLSPDKMIKEILDSYNNAPIEQIHTMFTGEIVSAYTK